MISVGYRVSIWDSSVRVLEVIVGCECGSLPMDGEGTVGIPYVRLPYVGYVGGANIGVGGVSHNWDLSVINFNDAEYLERDKVISLVSPYVIERGWNTMLKLSYGGEKNVSGDSSRVEGRVKSLTGVEDFVVEYFGSVYDLLPEEFDIWRISDLGEAGGLRVHKGNIGDVYSGGWGYNVGRVFDVFIGAGWGSINDIRMLKKMSKNGLMCEKYSGDSKSFAGSLCTPFWVSKQIDLDFKKYEEMVK